MKFDNLSNFTDEELVNEFQTTESEGVRNSIFCEIYKRYFPKVYAWAKAAFRRGRLSESYIDDVVSAVFFNRLYPEGERRGLLGFRQECSLEVHIRMVTRSCIIDIIRGIQPKSFDEKVETQGDIIEQKIKMVPYRTLSPSPPPPGEHVIQEEMRKIVEAAIDLLAQGKRKDSWKDAYIIRMYYWKNMTDKKIGESLNMTEDAVRTRRHRALIKLRDILNRIGIKNLGDILL